MYQEAAEELWNILLHPQDRKYLGIEFQKSWNPCVVLMGIQNDVATTEHTRALSASKYRKQSNNPT